MLDVSTYTSNHISFNDILLFLSHYTTPGFAAKEEIIKAPVIGPTCLGLNCIFVPRGGSEEARRRTITELSERQQKIEKNKDYS